MSLQTRQELIKFIQERYLQAPWKEKNKILDELVLTTGYCRKYLINLLSSSENKKVNRLNKKVLSKKKYNAAIQQVLLTLWHAVNQICSKRLVPFIPDLLVSLERFGHLSLPTDVRQRLLEISPATVDRLLKAHRQENQRGLSTTAPGSLLKKQIRIRTFADWDEAV